MDYTYLLPGANGQMTSNSFNNNNNGSSAGYNGQGGYQMLGLQDGGTATFLPGQNYVVVPIQAIDEVQMSTSNFSAEYSNGLAVFNVIIKSGTNKFHGEGFEFVQNDKFEARNFFSPIDTGASLEHVWRHYWRTRQEGQGFLLRQLPAQSHQHSLGGHSHLPYRGGAGGESGGPAYDIRSQYADAKWDQLIRVRLSPTTKFRWVGSTPRHSKS